jgi:hypothetical protein
MHSLKWSSHIIELNDERDECVEAGTLAPGEFKFDTGPSFFAGLTTPNALNPLAAILTLLAGRVQVESI